MKLSDQMRARIAELVAKRSALHDEQSAILATAEKRDNKALTDDEQKTYDEKREAKKALDSEIETAETRLAEIVDEETRDAKAAEHRAKYGQPGEQRAHVVDAPVYGRDKVDTSYFRDLYNASKGDRDASERLRRNDARRTDEFAALNETERRALSTAAGAGGEFDPPLWLIQDFVAYARPGRKFADSIGPENLPSGVSSINLPKISGGTTTAIQASQNNALSQTDMTTTSVSSGISTIGGKQVVSMQQLQQSGIPFDQVVLRDLAADYAKQYDNQSINGSGSSGQLEGVYTYFAASGTVNVTYTQATPAVGGAGGFYAKIFNACSSIESSRFMAPDTIWMHPRRWNWVLSSSDGNNRPLVVPQGAAFNTVGSQSAAAAEGVVGYIGGLQVVTDANLVTNLGAGTNQDPVLVGVKNDLRLWESALQAQTFDATYADSAGVLFRVLAYGAAIPSRYTTSVSVITGTGLVAPSF